MKIKTIEELIELLPHLTYDEYHLSDETGNKWWKDEWHNRLVIVSHTKDHYKTSDRIYLNGLHYSQYFTIDTLLEYANKQLFHKDFLDQL